MRLNGMIQDLRQGWRMIVQRPGFALAAIASLALGIGACTVLFGAVNMLLLQPVPGLESSSRVVELGRGWRGTGYDTFGAPDLEDIRASVPALEGVFGYQL